jgi:hypothetical protein
MIIKKRKALWLGLILLLALMGLGIVMADGTMLSRNLVSSGGGIVSQNGVALHSATGQPAAGAVENDLTLCSGYWCGSGAPLTEPPIIEDEFELFLPITIK